MKEFLGTELMIKLIFQERLRATYACSTDQVKTVSVDGREFTFLIEEISDLSNLGTVEEVDI